MKIGIIGLPQVGKKTLFQLLTGEEQKAAFQGTEEIKVGVALLRDNRLDVLSRMYKPQKTVPAKLDIVLLPRFDKETIASGEFLKAIEKCDALVHIVRGFVNDAVFHVDGSVDPLRDVENVCSELILGDLILIEKRLERIAKEARIKADPVQLKEKTLLEALKKNLDDNIPVIHFSLSPEEKKLLSTYQFLTKRPLILVLNVNDNQLSDDRLLRELEAKYKDWGCRLMQISAKIEQELQALPESDRAAFLEDLGIKESALNQLSRLCYEALGLMSFFTVGEDEVRQWNCRCGAAAPEAAGAIHSDLERGFIRAEIMKYDELSAVGSEAKLKEAGKLYLKGKDYIVEDGDIMHVRFNV